MAIISCKNIFIGCAGWSVPKAFQLSKTEENVLSHLEQYATYFNSVEINSSFYRPHKPETYEKWAAAVPVEFRFAVKIPKTISHETRLTQPALLDPFLRGVAQLGNKCGTLLLQMPASFAFEPHSANRFFQHLALGTGISVVCEARHPSWGSLEALALLRSFNISTVFADPQILPLPREHLRADALHYVRLHGAPRLYYSPYQEEFLKKLSLEIQTVSASQQTWVVFDNTALGHAFSNALEVRDLLAQKIATTRALS